MQEFRKHGPIIGGLESVFVAENPEFHVERKQFCSAYIESNEAGYQNKFQSRLYWQTENAERSPYEY